MTEPVDNLGFEEAFAALQAVIEELRSEALTLDRSLELYQRGALLASHCNLLLTAAELRITQSMPSETSGKAVRETYLEVDW